MTTYKGIQGFTVQSLASDPSPLVTGQLWYNSGSNVWKVGIPAAGAWSSGGDVNNGRNQCAGAGRTSSAAIVMGGRTFPPATPYSSKIVESYDGTTWTVATDMTLERGYFNGVGTQTAALVTLAQGTAPPSAIITNTETYNGTGWTEVGDAVTPRSNAIGSGTTSACIYAGGATSTNPGSMVGNAEDYDGTSWTEVTDLNTARWKLGASIAGTPSATLVFAGSLAGPPWTNNIVEEWNGTSWAVETALGTARYGPGGAGISTNALCYGGYSEKVNTESWNGTAWTEVADLATSSYAAGNAGNASASQALFFAGIASGAPAYVKTQEWDGAPVSAKTVTTS